MQVPSYDMLGVRVNALTLSDLKVILREAVESDQKYLIANHNLHSVYLYHHDVKMQTFYERARYIHIDGMPLVWLGRLLGHPLRQEHRLAYLDFIRPLMAEATQDGWRTFYLGSKPGVAERGASVLRNDFPGLQMWTHHGYFSANYHSSEKVLKLINDHRPNLLMVGMGMPRQEHWILDNLDRLQVNVVMNSGALMDYLAGEIPTAPRWTGPLLLEWLYRLITGPAHVWKRYLLEPWFILWLMLTKRARRGNARR